MVLKQIDINADLGEGTGNDEAVMPFISSCSIACGGHFGNKTTMLSTIELAKEHSVKVGAHPSYPDADNFGRKILSLPKSELKESILGQLVDFYKACEVGEVPVHHIKLHGALYNYTAINAPTADAVLEAIMDSGERPKLYVPYDSILAKKAENRLPLVYEAFIDRRYNDDLTLLTRSDSAAVIKSSEEAWNQLLTMFYKKEVQTVQGNKQTINASTFCIHGDNRNCIEILQYIRDRMKAHSLSLLK